MDDFAIAAQVSALSLVLSALDPEGSLVRNDGAIAADATTLASLSKEVVGAAADGAARVVLRALTNSSGKVVFSISGRADTDLGILSRIGGGGSGPSVSVDTTKIADGVHVALVEYRVPLNFPDPAARRFPLQVTARLATIDNRNVETTLDSFVLRRPPILLIHGVWSSASTWQLPLQTDSRFIGLVHPIDYSVTSGASFSTNADVSRRGVQEALLMARNQRIAAVRVDVVAHSMGGILARIWAADPEYKRSENYFAGDFHKLITLDTPHGGSEGANLLEELRACRYTTCSWVGNLIEPYLPGEKLESGAVLDLAVGSTALSSMAPAPVPTHVIVGSGGDASIAGDLASFSSGARNVAWAVSAATGAWNYLVVKRALRTYVAELFHGDHDLVVGSWSQFGGIPPGSLPADEFKTPDAIHTNCTSSPVFSDRIVELLNQPIPSAYFTDVATPVQPRSLTVRTASASLTGLQPLTMASSKLVLVFDRTGIAPGDHVRVHLQADVAAFDDGMLIGPCGVMVRNGPSLDFDCVVSQVASGTAQFTAAARRSNMVFISDPTTMPIVQRANMTALRASTALAVLSPGGRTVLDAMASYSDGVERVLTTDVTFESSDPFVGSVDPSGVVRANHAGRCTIVITGGGFSVTAELVVTEAAGRHRVVRH